MLMAAPHLLVLEVCPATASVAPSGENASRCTRPGRTAPLLSLRDSHGAGRDLALAEGHGRWIQPLASSS